MKTLIATFAMTLALALFRPGLRRSDRRKDRGRLREGGWHMERYD